MNRMNMNRDDLLGLVTAYADNELRNPEEVKFVEQHLAADENLRVELQIQKMMKQLVRERIKTPAVPIHVRERIVKKSTKPSFRQFIESLLLSPAFAFATLVGVVLIVLYSLNIQQTDFSLEQSGASNMFLQAEKNFGLIIAGKLAPQIVSSNPEVIQKFFRESGVKYSAVIPTFDLWKLVGGVVSEENGEKFAHHVYASPEGKIIYVYQVHRSYLVSSGKVSLSSGLVRFLDEGKCYSKKSSNHSTMFKKSGDNICAIVTNENADLMDKFISSF